MNDVAPEQAIDRRGGEEAHASAAVVASREARVAGPADDVRLDGHAVARLKGCDGRVGCQNDACRFMPKDVCACYDHGADAAGVPEVNIRSVRGTLGHGNGCGEDVFLLPTDTGAFDGDCNFSFFETLACLDGLEARLGFGDPEVMDWVGEDANIRLGDGDCRHHNWEALR